MQGASPHQCVCGGCVANFTLTAANTCTPCTGEGATACSPTNPAVATACQPGYGLFAGACQPCGPNCANCTSDGAGGQQCLGCLEGFWYNATTLSCSACIEVGASPPVARFCMHLLTHGAAAWQHGPTRRPFANLASPQGCANCDSNPAGCGLCKTGWLLSRNAPGSIGVCFAGCQIELCDTCVLYNERWRRRLQQTVLDCVRCSSGYHWSRNPALSYGYKCVTCANPACLEYGAECACTRCSEWTPPSCAAPPPLQPGFV